MEKPDIDPKDLSPEKAEFLSTLCERALQRTLDDRESIQQKGTFILAVLSGIVAFGVNAILENLDDWTIKWLAYLGLVLIGLIVICIILVWNYLPSMYAGHGYDPRKILKRGYVAQNLERMMIAYVSELQARINYNRKENARAAQRLKKLATVAFLLPVILLILFTFGLPAVP